MSPLFAAAQVKCPQTVGGFSDSFIDSPAPLSLDFTSQAVPLKEEWVADLEYKVNQRFTKVYNCYVKGRDMQYQLLHSGELPAPTADEHALYFLPAMTAKSISHVLHGYANSKLMFGQTSACFILPSKKLNGMHALSTCRSWALKFPVSTAL